MTATMTLYPFNHPFVKQNYPELHRVFGKKYELHGVELMRKVYEQTKLELRRKKDEDNNQ